MKIIIYKIWRPIYIWWSNFYWKYIKKAVTSYPLRKDNKKKKNESITDYIRRMSSKIMDNFEYTSDGIEQLGDSIPPPPEAYKNFSESVLKDDCDGYHSALYHIADSNDIQCELVCIQSLKNKYGHCVLFFYDNEWKVCDYKTIFNMEEALNHYTKVTDGKFVINSAIYDYGKKKLINIGEQNGFNR